MSFLGHLDQMRKHLMRIVKVGLVLFIAAFALAPDFIAPFVEGPSRSDFITYEIICNISQKFGKEIFCDPQLDFQMQNFKLMGQFVLHIRVAFMVTLVFLFPYAFWEVWRFIKPALRKKEKRVTRWLTFFVSILFTMGSFFGFYIITPIAINFFIHYDYTPTITNNILYSDYFKFISTSVLATGIMFQLPVTIYFFSKLGFVTPRFLRKYRKHAIVIILIVSAIITPPDVISQVLIGLPIFVLYEVSILISALVTRKARRRLAREERRLKERNS